MVSMAGGTWPADAARSLVFPFSGSGRGANSDFRLGHAAPSVLQCRGSSSSDGRLLRVQLQHLCGQTLRILDDVFTVISTDATVWNGIIPHRTVQLQASGTYTRNDAYGNFAATYTDRYYFDPDSGFVVAESYEERDTNPSATFRFRAEVFVTASSYAVPLDLIPLALVDVGVPAAAVLAVAAMIRVRRGPSRLRIGAKDFPTAVPIPKAKSPADLVGLTSDGSPFFGPFLALLAERSVAERDPVVLALADRQLVGLALFDQESAMGSLFASDDAVARVLMKRVKMKNFLADATIPSGLLRAKEIDRFAILQRCTPAPRG